MKSFTFASALLFAAAALTGTSALPVADPQTATGCSTSTVTVTTTITTTSPTVTPTPLETSPPVPLGDYQKPIILSNTSTNALLAASLVMVVDETRPDTPIARYKQMGPDLYMSIPFTAAHAGRQCRFHFAFSGLADGGNGKGAEEIYALKSGTVDETLTYNKQPVLEDVPMASFLMSGAIGAGSVEPVEMYRAEKRADFVCPGVPTGYAVRGRDGAIANWSWNKGAVVEVLGESGWWDDGKGGVY